MTACPSETALARRAQAALPPEERAAVDEHAAGCATCAAALAALRSDEALFAELRDAARAPEARGLEAPGSPAAADSIPGYELVAELHRGGQGVVYRAVHRGTGRAVAVKVLLRGSDASSRDRARFDREVELASRLRHPGIAAIHDHGVTDDPPWYAMELVEGTRLQEFVARARLSVDAKLRLFHRILQAVTYAHRHGVIHRDLKPSNILIDPAGGPHVLDFGVAMASDAGLAHRMRVTATGEFLGTLAYASPEQVSGDPAAVDARTDVYSAGVLLYELLTGRLPYDVTGSMADVLERIAQTPPHDPRTFADAIDAELRTILDTALTKEPGRRYSSAESFARDVQHYLDREPIEARARSAWYVLRKALVRHRLALAVVALVATLLGTAVIASARARIRAEREREQAALLQDVFQDILTATGPPRMNANLRVLEVYEEAADRIENALQEAPDAQAAVQLAIGDAYRRLFMMRDAATHLRRALARYREAGADALQIAHCESLLGRVLSRLGERESFELLERALQTRRAALGAEHPLVAATQRDLAIAMLVIARDSEAVLDDARAMIAAALETYRSEYGEEHVEVAATKVQLASFEGRDDPERAEQLFREALAFYERSETEDAHTVEALTAYAGFLIGAGRFAEGEAMLSRSVALTKLLWGEARSVDILRRQAALHVAKGDLKTAEELGLEALAQELLHWAQRRPDEAPRLQALATRLASTAMRPPYAEAFAELRRFHGDGAYELANWANEVSRVLCERGRCEETPPLLDEALRIHCRLFGRDCPIRARSLWMLAEVHADAGDHARALPLLDELVAALERVGQGSTELAVEAGALRSACRTACAELEHAD